MLGDVEETIYITEDDDEDEDDQEVRVRSMQGALCAMRGKPIC